MAEVGAVCWARMGVVRRVAARAKEVVVVGRIVGRWIIGFAEVRRRSFWVKVEWDRMVWLASLTNLLFVNECWRGRRRRTTSNLCPVNAKKGIEMQMRETEIPKIKNQEETRKPNGSKENTSCYYHLP